MAPIIEVSDKDLNVFNQLGFKYKLRSDLENKSKIPSFSESNFVYVPSINTYFSKQRNYLGKNWFEAHSELQKNGEKMPTIPEFIEFLKYLKESNNKEYLEIFNDITKVKSSWRAEWLDADFKLKDNKLYINSNHKLDENGNLVPQISEVLDKNTLMSDKTPGISLDDYIFNNHTPQGLPTKKTKTGELYYWNPRSDNNSVAGFSAYSGGAGLDCNGDPSGKDADLGVRATKLRE